ncbi:MAG TPA: amidohydrolase family protein [Jatrophihabitans sp.]
MAILVEDGLIRDIRPSAGLTPIGSQAVVDRSDCTVAPGFVDAHVHLVFTCGHDHETTRTAVELSDASQLMATAVRSGLECLAAGITTVRDCGDLGFVTLRVRDAIHLGVVPGPRILAAGPPVTITSGHLSWCGNVADTPEEIRLATRRLCAQGVDVIKVMASGGIMTRESYARQAQFSLDELGIVVEEAHRLGRRVAAHALNTESIRRAVAAGVDTIEHCEWRAADGSYDFDPDLARSMAEKGITAVVTMAGITRLLLPEFSEESTPEVAVAHRMSRTGDMWQDHDWARRLRDAGVKLALASDAGVRFTPFRRFDETLRCGIVALDLTLSEAVSLATLRAAEALGIAHSVGSIEVGKCADLVMLDGLADEQTTTVGAVREVWRDAELVVDGDGGFRLPPYPATPTAAELRRPPRQSR